MTLRNMFLFLFGDSEAIRALARSRWTLVVGAFLVLSAGIARHYDRVYLPSDPMVLLHGHAASIGNATVIFLGLIVIAGLRGKAIPLVRGYLAFLGLFWMTAPLAWLYAVPYERFLDPISAIAQNMVTLAFVATWRVVLISRVIAVMLQAPFVPVFLLVALWADVILVGAMLLVGEPVLDIMGGYAGSQEKAFIGDVHLLVLLLGLLALPVLAIAAGIGLRFLGVRPVPIEPTDARPSRGAIAACAVVLVTSIVALALAQPEQYRLHRAELAAADNRGASVEAPPAEPVELPPEAGEPPELPDPPPESADPPPESPDPPGGA